LKTKEANRLLIVHRCRRAMYGRRHRT
jgi:hypothetical protein